METTLKQYVEDLQKFLACNSDWADLPVFLEIHPGPLLVGIGVPEYRTEGHGGKPYLAF